MKVRIFTDGACSGNPGPGGWASIFNYKEKHITLSGNEDLTTNNRMELMAVVKSLKRIVQSKKEIEFELYSDSSYVINAINNFWIKSWIKNNWKNSKNEEVKNKDLWIKILGYLNYSKENNININFIKVKGHDGNFFNEMADKIAKEEVNKAQRRLNNV